MRLVLDTNVVVSAALWRGAPYRLLELLRPRGDLISMFASAAMLEELAEVLVRPAMTHRLAAISRTPADVLRDYVTLVEVVEPASLRAVARDPDDDVIIGTAVAAGAELVITGDKPLLGLRRFGQVEIVSVAEAISRLSG